MALTTIIRGPKAPVRINPLPLLKKLLEKYGDDNDFEHLVNGLNEDYLSIEPGDYIECISSGSLKSSGIGIATIKDSVLKYLGSFDAQIAYNELKFLNLVLEGRINEYKNIVLPEPYVMELPGETVHVRAEEPELAFSTGVVTSVNNKWDSNMIGLYSIGPDLPGGPCLEITHLRGFDKKTRIQIPVHYFQAEDGSLEPSILNVEVQLPSKPKNYPEFKCSVTNSKPGTVNLREEGLCVPNGASTFSRMIYYSHGNYKTYEIFPRIIDGLFIDPDYTKMATELIISPVENIKEQERKRIFTHAYNPTGGYVPIMIEVDLFPDN